MLWYAMMGRCTDAMSCSWDQWRSSSWRVGTDALSGLYGITNTGGESEAASMLAAGRPEVMDALGRQFESVLIKVALKHTHGRKNDAAIRLGIGRNTITRKIHDLGIDGAKDD